MRTRSEASLLKTLYGPRNQVASRSKCHRCSANRYGLYSVASMCQSELAICAIKFLERYSMGMILMKSTTGSASACFTPRPFLRASRRRTRGEARSVCDSFEKRQAGSILELLNRIICATKIYHRCLRHYHQIKSRVCVPHIYRMLEYSPPILWQCRPLSASQKLVCRGLARKYDTTPV